MKSSLNHPVIERAQPWLGTLVTIRVEGLAPLAANAAIDEAFAEIANVHRCMSFHCASSDVAVLNRQAALRPVAVGPQTLEVLRWSLHLSAFSKGTFDISVAKELVDWKFLPRLSRVDVAGGSWRDIELRSDGTVFFHRPLWIDLGGIAKGYAVDRACERIRLHKAKACVINAGGDIRVDGGLTETIALDTGELPEELAVLQLKDGSIASSTGRRHSRWRGPHLLVPHVDGVSRGPAPADRFVCVAAQRCMVADALTKVVLIKGTGSAQLLERLHASAHIYEPRSGWRHLGPKMAA